MPLLTPGVSAADIDRAMDCFLHNWRKVTDRNLSMTTYLLSKDGVLWDLKPVVRAAGYEPKFNTVEVTGELLGMGFSYVRFMRPKKRTLGLRGFCREELNDGHTLYLPDRTSVENALASDLRGRVEAGPARTFQTMVRRFIRDQNLVCQVLVRAKGQCECCGGQTFITASGHWFLEVHHKQWLREGGADTVENMVALCPNCHRREHHGTDRQYY